MKYGLITFKNNQLSPYRPSKSHKNNKYSGSDRVDSSVDS